jgi:hypothetical protein
VARISLSSELKAYTGGETQLELDIGNVRQLFEALGARYPDLKRHLETGLAVAIDGEIYQDALLQPIGKQSEVLLFGRIEGG